MGLTKETNARRAVAVYDAMRKHFFVQDRSSLFRQTYPWVGYTRYSYLWEFSRALVGTLALAGVPRGLVGDTDYSPAVQDRFAALERYWDSRVSPPAYASYVLSEGGGDNYYDDNAWIALALIQYYRMGLTSSLDRAKQLFASSQSGWDTDPSDRYPGGVFWVKQGVGYGLSNHDRGCGATAGYAELGFHLHLITGSAMYDGDGTVAAAPTSLGANNMLNWVATYLDSTRRGSGLYWNVVRRDGSIDTNLWSYNQGVMIGANVLRYQLTANSAYLDQAAATAGTAMDWFGNFEGQPASFNAMLFQNMLMLYPYASSSLQSTMVQRMQSYADWAWDNTSARNPKANLFYFDDGGQPARGKQAAQLRDQGAMTQLYALLAWNSSDYGELT
jgi:hypothetical protein